MLDNRNGVLDNREYLLSTGRYGNQIQLRWLQPVCFMQTEPAASAAHDTIYSGRLFQVPVGV